MCDKEFRNTSVTNNYEGPLNSDGIPVRNACATVERPKQTVRPGKFNLKPIRLLNLKQELLEAANEPLKNIPEIEELVENVFDIEQTPNKSYTNKLDVIYETEEHNKSVPKVENSLKDTEGLDLLWLETPIKSEYKLIKHNNKTNTPRDNLLTRNLISLESPPPLASKLKVAIKENVDPKIQVSVPIIKETNQQFKELRVNNTSYIVLNQIGSGGSCSVYFCFDATTKSERAIKKVNLSDNESCIDYVNEVMLLQKLQKCDRIIKLYDYEIVDSGKCLLMVLEKGGLDLSKILKESSLSESIPKYLIMFYWMEMLYAVKQIHKHGIIHADVKPGNFLMINGHLKLIDLGISLSMQNDMTSVVRNIPIGSLNYMSPEALRDQPSNNTDSPNFNKSKYKINYKSDVWSLGCILYQLVYRKTPFQDLDAMWAKFSAITDPKYEIEYPSVNKVLAKIVQTIQKCLQYNLPDRPSIDELIEEYEVDSI